MHKHYHLDEQPLPTGYSIYEECIEIPGVHHNRSNALAFCRATEQRLEFEADPTNRHDVNAIKIWGLWKGWFSSSRKELGFVPREIASKIALSNLMSSIRPRLLKTYAGTDGFVEIMFQIIGPTDLYRVYRPLTDAPADQVRKALENSDPETAIALLLQLVETEESESLTSGLGVAPRPYADLAALYRKLKRRPDEIQILERFEKQKKARGRTVEKLGERLAKLRADFS